MNQQVRQEIRDIVREELSIFSVLISFKPELTTREACKMLKCERHWLSKHRQFFGGYIANGRGDLRFSTTKIIEYKRKKIADFDFNL